MDEDNLDYFIELFDWSNQRADLLMMLRKDFYSQQQLKPAAWPLLKPILVIIGGMFQRMIVVALPENS